MTFAEATRGMGGLFLIAWLPPLIFVTDLRRPEESLPDYTLDPAVRAGTRGARYFALRSLLNLVEADPAPVRSIEPWDWAIDSRDEIPDIFDCS